MKREKKQIVNPISSLSDRRKLHKQLTAKTNQPLEQRVAELEADTLRLVDLIIDIEKRLDSQHNTLQKLLRLFTSSK
jgi:acyl carrier protein